MKELVFRNFCTLALFFLTFLSYGKNLNEFSLKYIIDKEQDKTIDSVMEESFSPFDISFPGLQKQKLWFRLDIDNNLKEQDFFFTFNTISIDELIVYQKNKEAPLKIYEFKEKGKKNIVIPVNYQQGTTFYLEVSFSKSIYMPFEILSPSEYSQAEKNKLIQYGFYYGFSLVVIIINVFFFYQTKEKFFILYSLLALSISLILLELDGYFYTLSGNFSGLQYLALWFNTFLLITLAFFTSDALKLNSYNSWFNKIGCVLIVLSMLFFVIFSFTDELLWYSLGILFNSIALFLYWLTSILLFKKLVYARFIFVGYTIIYISNITYVLPSDFGFSDIGFTLGYFKLGSIIEMVVFLYAISYRYKGEILEKEKIQDTLDFKNEELETISTDNKLTFDVFIEKFNLTNREAEIAKMLLKGETIKEIAMKIFLSESTIKYHNKSIYEKTGVKNKVSFITKYKI